MTITGRIRDKALSGRIRSRLERHIKYSGLQARHRVQLQLWNSEWKRILEESDYYRQLAESQQLPAVFSSWEDLIARMPVTNREFLQRTATKIQCRSRWPDLYRITGGTTAQPLQLPAWNSELTHTCVDIWAGRSWYGIRPASRLFLIWGHSHLLGKGARGWLEARKREIRDRLLNYHRFSAYDLRPAAMQQAARELLRFRPDYIMGYSVALDMFARINAGLGTELRELGLKAVIGASEGFPAPDSRNRLEQLFQCRVAMEYGSAETNLMAHTHPEGGYQTFWQSYFLEALPGPGGANTGRVLITSLYPRCVPLIRYEVGDEILLGEGSSETIGLGSFRQVMGRSNDYVSLSDGALIHSEAFTHAVRSFPAVSGYQVIQTGEEVAVRVLAAETLPATVEEGIKAKLGKIHHGLATVKIKRVPRLEGTIAGKTPMILKHRESADDRPISVSIH